MRIKNRVHYPFRRLGLLALILIAGAPLPCLADDLEWQIELAEHSHSLGKSEETKALLVLAHERLVASRCMPLLAKDLSYGGSPTDPLCTKALERLLAVDAESPVAACAAKGIDNPECRARFRLQRVRAEEKLGSSPSDLDQKIETSKTAPRREELKRAINEVIATSQGAAPSPEILRSLSRLHRELLDISCRITGLRFEGSAPRVTTEVGSLLPAADTTPLPTLKATPVEKTTPAGPMESLLAKLAPTAPAKPLPTPLPQSHERIRLLTMECARTITDVLKAESSSSAAICYRDGFVNPSCIDALRRDRRRLTPKKAASVDAQKNPGFTGF